MVFSIYELQKCFPYVLALVYLIRYVFNSFFNTKSGDLASWSRESTILQPHKNALFSRAQTRYPFTMYPSGWFRVADSGDLKPGNKVLSVKYFGRPLVVFRGKVEGFPVVEDAHCHHGYLRNGNGSWIIEGNSLVCSNNFCNSVAHELDESPSTVHELKATPRKYHTLEKNGIIWIYFTREETNGDTTGGKPVFYFPTLPETSSSDWQFLRFRWSPRVHVQETAENAVDSGHFNVVHAFDTFPQVLDFQTDGPQFSIKMVTKRTLYGVWQAVNDMSITYFGLGIVHARVKAAFIHTLVVSAVTPVDDQQSEINLYFGFEKSRWNCIKNWVLRWYLQYHVGADFYHDIPIWEHKIYQNSPVLCKGDGPIAAVRRWCKQFY